MKNLYPLILSTLLVGLSFSCSKEDENPAANPDPVTFSIELEGNEQLLHQQERIWVESERASEIARVSFFLGNTLIGEDTEAPFELIWDTDNHPDGSYNLRVEVEDKQEQLSEKSRPITLSNTLFLASLPDNYLSSGGYWQRDLWLYLTDKAGNMIGKAHKLENGENALWKRPKGFNESISLNILGIDRSEHTEKVYYFLDTYQDFPLHNFSPQVTALEPVAGKNLTFINDIPFQTSLFVRNKEFSVGYGVSQGESLTREVPVYEDDDVILSYYELWDQENMLSTKHYRLIEAADPNVQELSFSSFTEAEAVPLSFPSSVLYSRAFAYWNINGYPTFIAGFDSNQHPAAAYAAPAQQEAEVSFVGAFALQDAGSFRYLLPRQDMLATLGEPSHKAMVDDQGSGSYMLTVSGSQDLVHTYWEVPYNPDNLHNLFVRQLQNPDQLSAFARPSLPDTLTEIIPALLSLTSDIVLMEGTSVDYMNLEGYDEYIGEVVLSKNNMKDYLNTTGGYSINYTFFNRNNGGRLDSSRKIQPYRKPTPGLLLRNPFQDQPERH